MDTCAVLAHNMSGHFKGLNSVKIEKHQSLECNHRDVIAFVAHLALIVANVPVSARQSQLYSNGMHIVFGPYLWIGSSYVKEQN